MTIRATQPISSPFGTYMPGDAIDGVAAPVIDAWLAAGIATSEQEDPPVTEQPKPAPKVERATAPKREAAVAPRQAEAPHKRFQTDGEPAAQRRFQQETS